MLGAVERDYPDIGARHFQEVAGESDREADRKVVIGFRLRNEYASDTTVHRVHPAGSAGRQQHDVIADFHP